MRVPFKKTYYDEREADNVRDLLLGVDYISKAKEELQGIYEGSTLFLTNSASSAFDLLFAALDLQRGGEVIMPSFTYPSAANTVLRYGLVPVFVDLDETTMALSLDDAQAKMTEKTVCVIPTHYGGSSVDMGEMKKLCGDAVIIEDTALSFGAQYRGKPLGSIGDYGVVSFHKTKNVSSEQGGLLLVNSKDDALTDKLQTIYDNGTDKQAFLEGKTHAYSWQTVGQNAAMPNMNAAVLAAQLDKAQDIKTQQRKIYEYYMRRFTGVEGVKLPKIPKYNQDNYHVFYIVFDNNKTRETVRKVLEQKGIGAYFHYTPLHASAMGQKLGYKAEDIPVTMRVSECMLRLPIYSGMSMEQCEYVADSVLEAL